MGFERVREEVAACLGNVLEAHPLTGGDINLAYRVRLEDGRQVFVKTHTNPPPAMYAREAEGLEWLAEAGALRVPRVLAVSARFLALELITDGRRARDHDAQLGRGLAALHRLGAPGFGGPHSNYIGTLPQQNSAERDWPTFYVRQRLEPQLRLAVDRGHATAPMRRDMDALFGRMPSLVGPAEPPARLHGDLWAGNVHVAQDGAPVLIDPAAYGGHREMDLAMMRLFGGFSQVVFDSYEAAFPLCPGWQARVALYQLYPLMVHANLFGGAYVSSVERTLRQCAR